MTDRPDRWRFSINWPLGEEASSDYYAPFCHRPPHNINQREVGPLQAVAPGPTEAVVLSVPCATSKSTSDTPTSRGAM